MSKWWAGVWLKRPWRAYFDLSGQTFRQVFTLTKSDNPINEKEHRMRHFRRQKLVRYIHCLNIKLMMIRLFGLMFITALQIIEVIIVRNGQ